RGARARRAGRVGVSLPRQSALDAALAANGRHALDYTGKVDVKLRASMPGRAAGQLILLQQLDTLEANADGVLPGDLAQRFAPEFRWLGDLTTPLRDLDVQLEELPSMAAGLYAADRADL